MISKTAAPIILPAQSQRFGKWILQSLSKYWFPISTRRVAVVYLAAHLGADGFGKLGFTQAVLVYLSLVSEFGVRLLGARTLARDRDRIRELIAPFLWARLLLLLVAAAAVVGIWLTFPKPLVVKQLILL